MLNLAEAPPSSDGYEQYFGLVESPFSLTPDPRFLFESRSHAEALDHLTSALQRREALVVITGEVGTGKTMLCRTVLDRLHRRTFLSNITNPLLTGDDLVKQILNDFGVVSKGGSRIAEASRHELIKALQQFLASLIPLQAHAVVMIDEAQHLQPEVLEYVRLLSNFETDRSKLLQIILVGQPELERILATPEMRQLDQRVSRRYQLKPLGSGEVQHYIERRLWIAHGGPAQYLSGPSAPKGASQGELVDDRERPRGVRFTPSAMSAIADLAGGLPRVINIICDRALELGARQHIYSVDVATVLEAARRLKIPIPVRSRLRSTRYLAVAASLLVITGLGSWGVRTAAVRAGRPPVTVEPAASDASAGLSALSALEPGTPVAPTAATDAGRTTLPLPEGESFTVVVASFRSAAGANRFAGQLEKQNLPAFTRTSPDAWHQVLVGPYASREEADEAQRQLESSRVTGSYVVPRGIAGSGSTDDSSGQ